MGELEDVGLELELTTDRLALLGSVQNTYLLVFQVLGALGLLLGSAGLGVVVMRNVAERRHELAILAAIGFRARTVRRLLFAEHGILLLAGAGSGSVAALLAVSFVQREGLNLPAAALLVASLLAFGLLSVWLAARLALRGSLLDALAPQR